MKKPPDVIYIGVKEPTITAKNWADLMEWARNKDEYIYHRSLGKLMLLTIK